MSRFKNIGNRVKETIANVDYRKFIGCGPYNVIMVNPTKKEIYNCNKVLKTDFDVPETEPKYLSTLSEQDVERLSKNNPNVNIGDTIKEMSFSFYCKTISDLIPEKINKCEIVTFKVRNVMSATKDKKQIIDAYGLSAWGTNEEIENNKIPQYTSGPALIDSTYKNALSGEVNLINFFKKVLLIPSPTEWNEARQLQFCSAEQRLQCIWYIDDTDWKQMFETGIIIDELKNSVKNVRDNNIIWIPSVIKTIENKENGSISEISLLRTDFAESMYTNTVKNNKVKPKSISKIINDINKYFEKEKRDKAEKNLPLDEIFEPCTLKEFKYIPTSESAKDFEINEFDDDKLNDTSTNNTEDLPF